MSLVTYFSSVRIKRKVSNKPANIVTKDQTDKHNFGAVNEEGTTVKEKLQRFTVTNSFISKMIINCIS
jgi:hypothetical protein